jgi:hypothetical protein
MHLSPKELDAMGFDVAAAHLTSRAFDLDGQGYDWCWGDDRRAIRGLARLSDSEWSKSYLTITNCYEGDERDGKFGIVACIRHNDLK